MQIDKKKMVDAYSLGITLGFFNVIYLIID